MPDRADVIPIFGATSIVGYNLAARFPHQTRGFVPSGNRPRHDLRTDELRLEDPEWIRRVFTANRLSTLIYTHAVCNVGNCEKHPDWAHDINVNHVRRVLDGLPANVRIVYISSDHVFGQDGCYTESSPVCPISVYGRTRVDAEALVLARGNALVLRHGLAVGPSFDGKSGHLDWLHYRTRNQLPLTIIKDESRSAIPVKPLCERIMAFALSEEQGLRHIPATRMVSRPELANYLIRKRQLNPLLGTRTRAQQPFPHLGRIEIQSDYSSPLTAPIKSVLDEDAASPTNAQAHLSPTHHRRAASKAVLCPARPGSV